MTKTISLSDYLKHRDEEFPEEWTDDKEKNAIDLLIRVNSMLQDLEVESVEVSSGWRPEAINSATSGAAKHSYHLLGQAIDLVDNKLQSLANLILNHYPILSKYELWMEDPASTKDWVHLDTGKRPDREIRVFRPRILG